MTTPIGPDHSTAPERSRAGAFELVLAGVVATAVAFVIDLVVGTMPLLTLLVGGLAIGVAAARIMSGYRRERSATSGGNSRRA